MKNDEKYNGWTNRETWAVKLYIDNDQGLYSYYVNMLNRSKDARSFAQELEDWFFNLIQDMLEDGNLSNEARGMILDIGSLWRVNWLEIAQQDYTEEKTV